MFSLINATWYLFLTFGKETGKPLIMIMFSGGSSNSILGDAELLPSPVGREGALAQLQSFSKKSTPPPPTCTLSVVPPPTNSSDRQEDGRLRPPGQC